MPIEFASPDGDLDKHLVVDEETEDTEEEPEFDLEPVKDFMEEFIGLILVGMKPYKDDVDEFDAIGKMITGVDIRDNKLVINVASVSNNEIGFIEMTPTLAGQFAQRSNEDEPNDNSRFRLNFLGGFSLEYLDSNNDGNITYVTTRGNFN